MREIQVSEITKTVRQMCMDAAYHLPKDIYEGLKKGRETEESSVGRIVLDQIIKNAEIADAEADAAADEIPQKENVAEKRKKESDRQYHPHAEQRRVQQIRAHGVGLEEHGERDLIYGAALEISACLRKEVETKDRQICYDEYASKIDHKKHPSRQSIRRRSGGIFSSYHIPNEKGTET